MCHHKLGKSVRHRKKRFPAPLPNIIMFACCLSLAATASLETKLHALQRERVANFGHVEQHTDIHKACGRKEGHRHFRLNFLKHRARVPHHFAAICVLDPQPRWGHALANSLNSVDFALCNCVTTPERVQQRTQGTPERAASLPGTRVCLIPGVDVDCLLMTSTSWRPATIGGRVRERERWTTTCVQGTHLSRRARRSGSFPSL